MKKLIAILILSLFLGFIYSNSYACHSGGGDDTGQSDNGGDKDNDKGGHDNGKGDKDNDKGSTSSGADHDGNKPDPECPDRFIAPWLCPNN